MGELLVPQTSTYPFIFLLNMPYYGRRNFGRLLDSNDRACVEFEYAGAVHSDHVVLLAWQLSNPDFTALF